jgi:5-formyltetrahydrofolate cyclo-ligase
MSDKGEVFLSSNVISKEKQHIRERTLALRQSLDPDDVRKAGLAVALRIREHAVFMLVRKVCMYASTGKEIPTWGLLKQFLEDGKTICVPDWEGWKKGSGIRLVAVGSPGDLLTEGRVVPQPRVTHEGIVPPDEIDLFIVPGVAFDQSGNRLGMGGGYFDRLLALSSPKATLLGLAYEFQVMAHLPSGSHDIPVHHVVTPDSWQSIRVIQ